MAKSEKIVSFTQAIELYKSGYRNTCSPLYYVTTDKLLLKHNNGAHTGMYIYGNLFSNEADSMVIEGDYVPAPTRKEALRFYIKKIWRQIW